VAPGRGQGVQSLPIILILCGDVFNLIGSTVPYFLVIISGAWLYPWAGGSQGTFYFFLFFLGHRFLFKEQRLFSDQ
jgi:hypothetical protein